MSEWLGKPRLRKEDIAESQPTLVEALPSLAEYFVEDQKLRVVLVIDHEEVGDFKRAVEAEFESFTADTARQAVARAVREWVDEKLKSPTTKKRR